jgi:hypothetical protein
VIEDYVGLHERIEIIYVVDGYEATLYTHYEDFVAQGWGSTIEEALGSLEAVVRQEKRRAP